MAFLCLRLPPQENGRRGLLSLIPIREVSHCVKWTQHQASSRPRIVRHHVYEKPIDDRTEDAQLRILDDARHYLIVVATLLQNAPADADEITDNPPVSAAVNVVTRFTILR